MNRRPQIQNVATSLAIATILTTAANGYAQSVFGNWESGTREGWIDWNTGTPTAVVEPPKFVFNSIGATLGTGAIQYNSPGGYTQWLAIKLQNDINDPLSNQIADYRPDFLEHTKLAFDITLDAAEQTVGNDFVNMGLFVNSNTWGFMRIGDPNNDNVPESVTPFTGFNGGKAFNPSQLVGVQTSTWTYDISFLHDGNAENGEIVEGDYIELIFEQFSNGPYVLHIDNVRFFTPVVLTADFVDDNVIDGQDFSAWKGGFGLSGQPHANGDATGEGVVNGEDFLHWQREFGATEGNALSSLGAVPEPHALLLGAVVIAAASVCRGRFSVRRGTRSRPALYKSQGVKRE